WEKTFEYWKEEMWKFTQSLGLKEKSLRWREHEEFERSHYSKRTMDIEYRYPFGWKEMFGIAYRTNFDLSNHMKHSGKDLSYIDPLTKETLIPHVIEPTFGLSRLTGIVLTDAFVKEEVNGKERFVLKLNPKIAPVKAAIFPLQKDEKLVLVARKLFASLKKQYVVEYDNRGNIGKMYRRQDEIGTPYCITVDYQTLEDRTVTIRERDTMKQERISMDKVADVVIKRITNS
ncbi:glycine--tRNA ligase, partial [Candidatus Roizmanbacteria bacterium CG03_land_8_20_14_0_80_39_12]